jgi:hypothetical protein
MSWLWIGLTISLAAAGEPTRAGQGATEGKSGMDERSKMLEEARRSERALGIALPLAKSAEPHDQQTLLRRLTDPQFLAQLDSDEDYENSGQGLAVGQVLEALSRNQAPSAKDALVSLTQAEVFTNQPARADLLIRYSATVRPPPPALIRFWDAHSRPEDGFTPLTIEALVVNGTPPALGLLEQKMADAGHDNATKTDWLRQDILPHRNDVELLRSCRRMLAGSMPAELRPALIEVLFDYRPDEWYPEHGVVAAPDRHLASAETKAELRLIAQFALAHVALESALKTKVEAVLKELARQ